MAIKSMAVFCGSKMGNNAQFEQDAKQLGHILADKNISLIYGGGGVGIMGAISNTVLQNKGTVIGIIPTFLKNWEQHNKNITELIEVDNMHIRKQMMYEKGDAAIILPGGFGTMDELFEMLTWNQLKIHSKQIFILNSAGFYDHLLAHAKTMFEQGFLYDTIEERITVINTPTELLHYI